MSTASYIIPTTWGKDVSVTYSTPTANHQYDSILYGVDTIGTWSYDYGRPFFHFDLTPLNRTGVVIVTATLSVTVYYEMGNYSDTLINIHKASADYTASTVTWNTQPATGASIATILIPALTGTATVVTSGDFASSVQSALSSNYIVLMLNDDSYTTTGAFLMQSSYPGNTNYVTKLNITYKGSSFSGSLLANACGDATASYNGTTVRGSAVSSNVNEYAITAGGSSITPTTITQGVTSNITFNPGSGAQVSRINTGRTYLWSKVSGITGTLTNTTSNPCTLNCAGTGTYTIQCVYHDDYTGDITKSQAITSSVA